MMRPLSGDDAWAGRPRSADREAAPFATSASNSQVSFFLADEATVDSLLEQPSLPPRQRDAKKGGGEPTFASSSKTALSTEPPRPSSRPGHSDGGFVECSPVLRASPRSHQPPSPPITPMMLGASSMDSAPSTPSSRRNSLAGSLSDHAVSSDDECPVLRGSSDLTGSGSAPQLVMPSIKMPSRRPFTDVGKGIGHLKLMIAGDTGVGKTSLVKAIVQLCEHIVHVDTTSPQTQPGGEESSKLSEKKLAAGKGSNSTVQITEAFASTRPYPEWWPELDEPQSGRRRKSLGDSVLERNICFVDTPGFANGSSAMETIVSCVEYVESHLSRMSSDYLNDSDMLKVLGGNGGFQVDAVLYLVANELKGADLEYIRRLAPLTNIIPLLAKSDGLTDDQVATRKQRISAQFEGLGIRAFSFVPPSAAPALDGRPTAPYAVSSTTVSDHDVMDASLLMSPDYLQPLMKTELAYLLEQVFCANGSSWLRHAAAKKYLQWRDSSNQSKPRHLYQPLDLPPESRLTVLSGALIPRPSNLALARIREQSTGPGFTSLRVVDWAADLQRSLAWERRQLETLARSECAGLLAGGLAENTNQGSVVPARGAKAEKCSRRKPSRKTLIHQDPLGLLQASTDLKAKGWVILELLGGLGVLGGLAMCILQRRCHLERHLEPIGFGNGWAVFFMEWR